MKANEFVKKHGWDAVIKVVKSTTSEETAFFESTDLDPILSKCGETIGFNVKVYRIKYEEVKRLVESHELVGGDLEYTKKFYADCAFKSDKHLRELKKAIADVESCQ